MAVKFRLLIVYVKAANLFDGIPPAQHNLKAVAANCIFGDHLNSKHKLFANWNFRFLKSFLDLTGQFSQVRGIEILIANTATFLNMLKAK